MKMRVISAYRRNVTVDFVISCGTQRRLHVSKPETLPSNISRYQEQEDVGGGQILSFGLSSGPKQIRRCFVWILLETEKLLDAIHCRSLICSKSRS